MKNLLFSLFILSVFFVATNTFAVDATTEDILVNISPANPKPFSDTTITLSSFSTDLNKANIEWKSSGKLVLAGTGKTKYIFKAGGPNTTTSFDISIIPEESISTAINKTIVIKPSDMDLLWEATDSYTPPFYRGKALPSTESQIKIVAYPNTSGLSTANQKNITYTWKNNYDTVGGVSGFGKSKYIFTNDSLKNVEKVSVTGIGPNGSYNSEGKTEINIEKPQIIFYKKSPTEGIFYANALIDESYLEEDEITFVAEPYYLSFKNGSLGFDYNWKINGNSIETPSKKRELTVRPSSRGGYASVGFGMESMAKLFQNVTNSIKIKL